MNSYIFYGVLCQLLIVAWIDLKKKTISNYWAMVNVFIGIVLYVAIPELYPFNWELFLFPIGFIIGGFILFLASIMGAGDSKYLASLFIIVPSEFHMIFFEKILYATMAMGLLRVSWKVLRNFSTIKAYLVSFHWRGLRDIIKSRFSYAPVILLAWMLLGLMK